MSKQAPQEPNRKRQKTDSHTEQASMTNAFNNENQPDVNNSLFQMEDADETNTSGILVSANRDQEVDGASNCGRENDRKLASKGTCTLLKKSRSDEVVAGSEMRDSWNDYEKKGPWVLPEGAEMIVKQMAAEKIFWESVNVILEESRSVDHRALNSLLREFPGLCHRTYEIKWDNEETRNLYPMAILCCLKPELSLLKFIHQVNPEALFHKESVKGTLPFHYACTFQANLNVIDWMIELDSMLVRTPRKDLMYPLHLAAYFSASYEVVNRLIQAWPEAVEHQDSGSWSILHAAASGQATLDIVQKLYSLNPGNILALDDKRRTPLHLACWKKGNPEVVSYLLSCAPQAINMEDEGAESPLFRASRNQSLEVLRILLPEHTPPLDELGASVLHFASLDNTADVVEYLLHRFPDMAFVRTRDRDRYTPLHGACHFDAPLTNVKALVKHAPTTLLMVNGHGKTPLETAEQCRVSAALVKYLTEATHIQRKAQSNTLDPVQNNQDNSYRGLNDAANQIVFPNRVNGVDQNSND